MPPSPAPGLIINPSSISSPLSNSAAKGLAGARVSLPYQLRAGRAVQSRRIHPRCLPQQAWPQNPLPPPISTNPYTYPSLDTLPPTYTPSQITHTPMIFFTQPSDPTRKLMHMQILSSVRSSGLGETCPVKVRKSLRCLIAGLYLRL